MSPRKTSAPARKRSSTARKGTQPRRKTAASATRQPAKRRPAKRRKPRRAAMPGIQKIPSPFITGKGSVKTAATYSPTVTQYHRRGRA